MFYEPSYKDESDLCFSSTVKFTDCRNVDVALKNLDFRLVNMFYLLYIS